MSDKRLDQFFDSYGNHSLIDSLFVLFYLSLRCSGFKEEYSLKLAKKYVLDSLPGTRSVTSAMESGINTIRSFSPVTWELVEKFNTDLKQNRYLVKYTRDLPQVAAMAINQLTIIQDHVKKNEVLRSGIIRDCPNISLETQTLNYLVHKAYTDYFQKFSSPSLKWLLFLSERFNGLNLKSKIVISPRLKSFIVSSSKVHGNLVRHRLPSHFDISTVFQRVFLKNEETFLSEMKLKAVCSNYRNKKLYPTLVDDYLLKLYLVEESKNEKPLTLDMLSLCIEDNMNELLALTQLHSFSYQYDPKELEFIKLRDRLVLSINHMNIQIRSLLNLPKVF